ncbi:MAG: ATP-binding cassette domain-containing protein [Acidimicrobiales bacterium]|nr:ATP-binding cassette domain-containing protein [Acidimicrobiales bacterium]
MLSVDQVEKRFGAVQALDGCSLRVERGRQVGLLGQNGAGKTTLMRSIFGLVALDGGTVTWDGDPIGGAVRARFGYLPEERGLYPAMGVHEQLVHLARLHGLGRTEAEAASRRRLEEVGLADRADDRVEALSHGNQQRAQLAAAVVHEPDLLVLDEPFAGLDPLGVDAMGQVLRAEVERGAAVLFSSHQLDLVESRCDDVVIIDRGRDVLAGPLAEVRAGSDRRRVEVAFAADVRAEQLTAAGLTVLGDRDGLLLLSAPADRDPAGVLAQLQRLGEVRRFAFEPPHLSDLYREAVQG